MKLRVRRKLFSISVALILPVLLLSGLIVTQIVRGVLNVRIEQSLLHAAGLSRDALELSDEDDMQQLAKRLGRSVEARLTIVASDGRVLADSALDESSVAQLENHAGRPEIVAANKDASGIARRYSTTLATEMLYVARPFQRPGLHGVVRVARPLSEVEAAVGRLRWILVAGGLLGIVVAGVISLVAAHLMTGSLIELRAVEKMRRGFVASVSHELRTPVSVIRANAETLLDGAIDDTKRAPRFLDAIMRNAERLSAIVTDLLDLARIEEGEYPFEFHNIDVRRLVKQSMATVDKAMRDRGIEPHLEILDGDQAYADPSAMEHILINYLENAAKFAPENGNIWVRGVRDGRRYRIEVADDGPGIPEKHRSRIFERFYRVDKGRSREMGGTGLGLSIVKNLAEGMKAEVGVEARTPQGSVFWVSLPAARANSRA